MRGKPTLPTRTLLIASLFLTTTAFAADAPRVVVRTSLEPRSVTIGEAATLKVDILTETFFLSAPELPALSIPGAIVTLSDERPEHLTEDVGGTTMFGLRRTYRFTPIVASDLAIPTFSVIAHPGPGEHSVTVATTAQQLSVDAPEGAEDAFVTRGLTMKQKVDADLTKLKVGDSFMRTVEVTATGTPGMFIPDIAFDDIDGLAAYPKAPTVSDADPGQPVIGHRTFAVEYVVQQPGDHELPALSIRWWNLDARKLAEASVPALTAHAVAAPPPPAPFAVPKEEPSPIPAKKYNWKLVGEIVAVAVAAIALAWGLSPFIVRGWRRSQALRRERRQQYRNSESYAYKKLRSALRRQDAAAVAAALYRWLDRIPKDSVETSTTAATQDAQFVSACQTFFAACYGEPRNADNDAASRLRKILPKVRRRVLRADRSHRPAQRSLPRMNPA